MFHKQFSSSPKKTVMVTGDLQFSKTPVMVSGVRKANGVEPPAVAFQTSIWQQNNG